MYFPEDRLKTGISPNQSYVGDGVFQTINPILEGALFTCQHHVYLGSEEVTYQSFRILLQRN